MNLDKSIAFLAEWITTSVALLLLSEIFKKQIVLGNSTIVGTMSAVICAFVFTVVVYFAPLVSTKMDLKFKDERICIILDALLLIPFIWILKKFALSTGLGISNNFIILFVAFIISLVCFYTSKYTVKYLGKLGTS